MVDRNQFQSEGERLQLLEHKDQLARRIHQLSEQNDELRVRLEVVGEALKKLNEHHTRAHHQGGADMPVDQEIAWALILYERPHMLKAYRLWRGSPDVTYGDEGQL